MSTHDALYNPHDHEPMPEGEEEAPPMTRTMSLVRWVLLGLITGFALVMLLGWLGLNPLSSSEASATQYHCPMHPTYVSSQPGECPICGMNLVPIKQNNSASAESTTTDSSHANHSDVSQSTAKPGQYTCPMDPDVISDTPGDCSKCGMPLELVPQSSDSSINETHSMADMPASPVPGLVTLTLDPKRLQLIGIKTGVVEHRPLESALKLAGYVTPDESKVADLHLRVNGWVKKLYVNKTGEQVKAGEPLLTIYSQDLYQAQQDLLVASQAMSRSGDKSLTEIRRQLYEAARQRLALLGLSETEITLIEASDKPSAELTLKSPFTGVVLEKSVVEGQFVGPDQNLFTIADLRRAWVLADIYEQDLGSVTVGTPVSLTATSSNEKQSGKVTFIYPIVSSETRTAKIRLEFENHSMQLRPGMYVDLNVMTESDSALVVSSDAVMDGGETKYVFVVHNNVQFEPRLVTIGRSNDDWYEVLTGLQHGETVVTSANFLIDSESRLQAAITGMGGTQAESPTEHTH